MRLIDADALLAEYDRQHEGPAGKARKLIEDAPAVPREMTAREFVYEHQRLELWCIGRRCNECNYFMKCPINRSDLTTREISEELPLFVEQWAKDHPEGKTDHPKKRKTYAEDFKERFGHSWNNRHDNWMCREKLYHDNPECTDSPRCDCEACWQEEMEENNE